MYDDLSSCLHHHIASVTTQGSERQAHLLRHAEGNPSHSLSKIGVEVIHRKVFFATLDSPEVAMKTWFASPGGSVVPGTRWRRSCASTEDTPPRDKNKNNHD
ncbi:hypothetical protein F5X97DRAFT_289748 [Nemania serpens]|nr:hypothetical protein F5X97DRAFT_289748 [Nemania serpens]